MQYQPERSNVSFQEELLVKGGTSCALGKQTEVHKDTWGELGNKKKEENIKHIPWKFITEQNLQGWSAIGKSPQILWV